MKKNEKEALAQLKRVLLERFAVRRLVLYGSKARGQAAPDSDVDVMVELEEYTPAIESDIDEAVFEINLAYDCLISTVIFGRTELEIGALGESPLYRKIEREGITL